MATGKQDGDRKAELKAAIERVVEEHLKARQTLSGKEERPSEPQNVTYEDDIIQEHHYSPVYKLLFAIAIAAIFSLWLLLNFAQRYAEKRLECGSDEDCGHALLKDIGIVVALILAIPCAIWVWRSVITKRESGSRIDLGKRLFVWWDGPLPRVENSIEIDKIVCITLVEADESARFEHGDLRIEFLGDGKNIELVDTTGTKITVRGLCVKSTTDWVRALKSEFPHIRIETD